MKGRSGLAGSNAGRTFHKRSFIRPSWMDEDMVDSADTSESVFFSKVGRPPLTHSLALLRSDVQHWHSRDDKDCKGYVKEGLFSSYVLNYKLIC